MYILFGGDYVAIGGAHDIIKISDDLKYLKNLATDMIIHNKFDWWHIMDFDGKQIVNGSIVQSESCRDLPSYVDATPVLETTFEV